MSAWTWKAAVAWFQEFRKVQPCAPPIWPATFFGPRNVWVRAVVALSACRAATFLVHRAKEPGWTLT